MFEINKGYGVENKIIVFSQSSMEIEDFLEMNEEVFLATKLPTNPNVLYKATPLYKQANHIYLDKSNGGDFVGYFGVYSCFLENKTSEEITKLYKSCLLATKQFFTDQVYAFTITEFGEEIDCATDFFGKDFYNNNMADVLSYILSDSEFEMLETQLEKI